MRLSKKTTSAIPIGFILLGAWIAVSNFQIDSESSMIAAIARFTLPDPLPRSGIPRPLTVAESSIPFDVAVRVENRKRDIYQGDCERIILNADDPEFVDAAEFPPGVNDPPGWSNGRYGKWILTDQKLDMTQKYVLLHRQNDSSFLYDFGIIENSRRQRSSLARSEPSPLWWCTVNMRGWHSSVDDGCHGGPSYGIADPATGDLLIPRSHWHELSLSPATRVMDTPAKIEDKPSGKDTDEF